MAVEQVALTFGLAETVRRLPAAACWRAGVSMYRLMMMVMVMMMMMMMMMMMLMLTMTMTIHSYDNDKYDPHMEPNMHRRAHPSHQHSSPLRPGPRPPRVRRLPASFPSLRHRAYRACKQAGKHDPAVKQLIPTPQLYSLFSSALLCLLPPGEILKSGGEDKRLRA